MIKLDDANIVYTRNGSDYKAVIFEKLGVYYVQVTGSKTCLVECDSFSDAMQQVESALDGRKVLLQG